MVLETLANQTEGEKVDVYHIEDDEDWRIVVKAIIVGPRGLHADDFGLARMHYLQIDGPLQTAISALKSVLRPSIVIFDLRLDHDSPTEYATLKWLIDKSSSIRRAGSEVFIISGFIPDDAHRVLQEYGIPSEHIFEKATFSKAALMKALGHASERIRLRLANGARPDPVVYEISARFPELSGTLPNVLVIPNRPYKLELVITSFEGLMSFESLIGRALDIHIDCPGTVIYPGTYTALRIPEPNQTTRREFTVSFGDDRHQHMTILVYHNNHLLRLLKFTFTI